MSPVLGWNLRRGGRSSQQPPPSHRHLN
jgi:hypothetical protein